MEFPPRTGLVLRRLFHRVDDEDIDRRTARIELQAELFL
jgi:hypothetical protein